jgi:hypothetical protein
VRLTVTRQAVRAPLWPAISPFKQGIGQLKALMFVGAGIEDHQRTRTKTFDPADGMLAKPTTIV